MNIARLIAAAALGCGAGVLVNKERVKKIDAKEQEKKVAARKKRERVAQRDNRDLTPLR